MKRLIENETGQELFPGDVVRSRHGDIYRIIHTHTFKNRIYVRRMKDEDEDDDTPNAAYEVSPEQIGAHYVG